MSFLNRVGFETATTGDGTLTVGDALPGYATPADAGAENGVSYTWVIEDGDDFEIVRGGYSSSGPTVARDTVLLSKIGGSYGTAKLNLSGTATVRCVAAAEDLLSTEATLKGRLAGTGTGAPANLSVSQILALLGAFSGINVQVFTSNGTYTPTAGMKFVLAIGQAPGGGGGSVQVNASSQSSAAGGSAGSTGIDVFTAAQIGASRTVTVPAGGTAGTGGGNGGNGSDLVITGLMTVTGGAGGNGVTTNGVVIATPNATANPTGSLINVRGGHGLLGSIAPGQSATGGQGGASFFGQGGPPGHSTGGISAGAAAFPYGAGGGGGASRTNAGNAVGGAGGGGILILIEFL